MRHLGQSELVCAELLELLLCEENVMNVVGALEYDPELAARQNHRAFLREHVIFKEVIPTAESSYALALHQNDVFLLVQVSRCVWPHVCLLPFP